MLLYVVTKASAKFKENRMPTTEMFKFLHSLVYQKPCLINCDVIIVALLIIYIYIYIYIYNHNKFYYISLTICDIDTSYAELVGILLSKKGNIKFTRLP